VEATAEATCSWECLFLQLQLSLRSLELLQEPIIICMGADPEPDDRVTFHSSQGTVGDAHPCRVDRGRTRVHLLETEARVRWVLREKRIRLPGLLLDVSRERRQQLAEVAGRV
jgi:hypothetical protein